MERVSQMSVNRRSSVRLRLLAAGLVLVVAGSLSACKEVEEESSAGYEPTKLHEIKGNEDLKRVTFTKEAANRIGLETARVRYDGGRKDVPYAALIYDPEGKTYVYTSRKPLSYLRQEVQVDDVDGDHALLSKGPPAGTEVVTVGAAQVHGAELEIAEK
jgi:hypothetical protein